MQFCSFTDKENVYYYPCRHFFLSDWSGVMIQLTSPFSFFFFFSQEYIYISLRSSFISSIGGLSTYWILDQWFSSIISLFFSLCLTSSHLCLLSPPSCLWVAGPAWPSPLREKRSSSHSTHIHLWKTSRVLLLRRSPFPRKISWIWGRLV